MNSFETIEASWHTGDSEPELWGQYAKRAEELLITMPLDRILRVLKSLCPGKVPWTRSTESNCC